MIRRRKNLTVIERAAVANERGSLNAVAQRWQVSIWTVRRIRRLFRDQARGIVAALVCALAAVNCGAVVPAGQDASAVETSAHLPNVNTSTADASTLDATDGGRDARPDVGTEARTCAPWPTSAPPYCASCRDDRGVCRCGVLPCCDQGCQS